MKLVNIETHATKRYTFRNADDEVYHVVEQASCLTGLDPEFCFMDHNLNVIVDDEILDEIRNVMAGWEIG